MEVGRGRAVTEGGDGVVGGNGMWAGLGCGRGRRAMGVEDGIGGVERWAGSGDGRRQWCGRGRAMGGDGGIGGDEGVDGRWAEMGMT